MFRISPGRTILQYWFLLALILRWSSGLVTHFTCTPKSCQGYNLRSCEQILCDRKRRPNDQNLPIHFACT
ncbi:hypothetical protein LB505_006673 [Fusarium chuoi]|nr:hypothetical protein LB505_006673 [Fusarium chuoi]